MWEALTGTERGLQVISDMLNFKNNVGIGQCTVDGYENCPMAFQCIDCIYLCSTVEDIPEMMEMLEGLKESYDELMDRYIACDLYLRRIELGITPGAEEATGFLRAQQISPYAVHAVLYHPTSYLGHREQILLRLAEDALTGRQYRTAYDYLSVIEEASAGTLALKEKLGALIGRGAG